MITEPLAARNASGMTTHTTKTRWVAGFIMMAGLGAAVVTGGAVASADSGTTTVGPTSGESSDTVAQKERRRATFSGACVTEVKLDDLDANNNKK